MKAIKTLADLFAVSRQHKAVVVPHHAAWNKPKPAAFMIHLPGIQLLALFRIGMYVYDKDGIVDAEFEPKENKEKDNEQE